MKRHTLRVRVQVSMHLNEGYTKVALANGGGYTWDIPTQIIPPPLRPLGSRFIVITQSIWPEPDDTGSELREAPFFRVEELEET
jgi:hypothetical protein